MGILKDPITNPNNKYKVLHLCFVKTKDITLEIIKAPNIIPRRNTVK